MKVLAFAEQRDNKFRKSSFETVQAAKKIAGELNAEFVALVIGSGVSSIVAELGHYGSSRVVVVDDPSLLQHSNSAYAKVIAEIAKKESADIVFLPASQMGKDIAPRIAVKLEAGLASDCIALKVENGEITATRPVFAGKALLDVKVNTAVKMFTLRPNVFTAVATEGIVTTENVLLP